MRKAPGSLSFNTAIAAGQAEEAECKSHSRQSLAFKGQHYHLLWIAVVRQKRENDHESALKVGPLDYGNSHSRVIQSIAS